MPQKHIRDEGKWTRAKKVVKKQYGKTEADGDEFWELVMGVYKQARGTINKKGKGTYYHHRRGGKDVKRKLEEGREQAPKSRKALLYVVLEKSTKKDLPPGGNWKTVRGAKVYMDKDGDIVAGAEGKLSGNKGSGKTAAPKKEATTKNTEREQEMFKQAMSKLNSKSKVDRDGASSIIKRMDPKTFSKMFAESGEKSTAQVRLAVKEATSEWEQEHKDFKDREKTGKVAGEKEAKRIEQETEARADFDSSTPKKKAAPKKGTATVEAVNAHLRELVNTEKLEEPYKNGYFELTTPLGGAGIETQSKRSLSSGVVAEIDIFGDKNQKTQFLRKQFNSRAEAETAIRKLLVEKGTGVTDKVMKVEANTAPNVLSAVEKAKVTNFTEDGYKIKVRGHGQAEIWEDSDWGEPTTFITSVTTSAGKERERRFMTLDQAVEDSKNFITNYAHDTLKAKKGKGKK